jgi:hypothetical protein
MKTACTTGRAPGKRVAVKVRFGKEKATLSRPEIHLSKKDQDVVEFQAGDGKIVGIEFTSGPGCPVTGFFWGNPSNVWSGPLADWTEVGKRYEYTLFVKLGRKVYPIDPVMIPDV